MFKNSEDQKILIKYLVSLVDKYENLLKEKGIIDHRDITRTRSNATNWLDHTQKERLKLLIAIEDPHFQALLTEAIKVGHDSNSMQDLIKDAVFFKSNKEVRDILEIIEKKGAEDEGKKLTEKEIKQFVIDKYGEHYWNDENDEF